MRSTLCLVEQTIQGQALTFLYIWHTKLIHKTLLYNFMDYLIVKVAIFCKHGYIFGYSEWDKRWT